MLCIIAVCVEYWEVLAVMAVIAIAVICLIRYFAIDLWWEYKVKCDGSHPDDRDYYKRIYEKKKLYRKLDTPSWKQDEECKKSWDMNNWY
jgi:hypothetical protein